MSGRQPVDLFAEGLRPEVRHAVLENARAGHEKRTAVLFQDWENPDALRRLAGEIKQHTLEHLDGYLESAEAALQRQGAVVHWAYDAQAARQQVLEILQSRGATRLVKSKTMVSEEIELEPFLTENGVSCVETDLGEFIVQIDRDRPSHIVKPILHKNRREIAASFEREGLGPYDDDPEVITRRARAHLRREYLLADAALTGANFLVAETGRLVVITNEGNSRFCLAAARTHIALIGIEKLVPREADLAVFLNLLARSATGQAITVYNEFINGPRGAGQLEGPDEMHVILIDNGRSEILAGDCREILRCIRCGACMNVCPVYRQASGHAYRSVYPGPLGAVLSPLLAGNQISKTADLPHASSLCGACQEVCPVDIPIPDLLLRLRDRAGREGVSGNSWRGWAWCASHPRAWQMLLRLGSLIRWVPPRLMPVPPLRAWLAERTLPPWRGGAFRKWMARRSERDPK